MRLLAPIGIVSVVAMMACTEQGSSRLATTAPSQLSDGAAVTPSNRVAGPVATAASRMTATVQFGQPNVGSPFPPTSGHDRSAHAVDNLVPRTVVIDKGGTVTFRTFGVHQVAVYDDGTEPDDIDTSDLILTPAGCPKPMGAALMIDDDTNRIAVYPQPCGPAPREVTHTFPDAGRYLVICAFLPHFEVQMYGWVIVRE